MKTQQYLLASAAAVAVALIAPDAWAGVANPFTEGFTNVNGWIQGAGLVVTASSIGGGMLANTFTRGHGALTACAGSGACGLGAVIAPDAVMELLQGVTGAGLSLASFIS